MEATTHRRRISRVCPLCSLVLTKKVDAATRMLRQNKQFSNLSWVVPLKTLRPYTGTWLALISGFFFFRPTNRSRIQGTHQKLLLDLRQNTLLCVVVTLRRKNRRPRQHKVYYIYIHQRNRLATLRNVLSPSSSFAYLLYGLLFFFFSVRACLYSTLPLSSLDETNVHDT